MNKNTANELLNQTLKRMDGAYADSTTRAYRVDFEHFIKYCEESNENPLLATPETICLYIKSLIQDGRNSASIRRVMAGMTTIHKLNRFQNPTKDSVLIRKSKTDQLAKGRRLCLSEKATKAINSWLERCSRPKEGQLFKGINRGQKITGSLGSGQISRIHKRLAKELVEWSLITSGTCSGYGELWRKYAHDYEQRKMVKD